MKKMLILIGLLVFLAGLQSHAPSDMEISFDAEEQILTLVIMHGVGDHQSHYIGSVTVSQGGKEIIVQQLSRQDDNEKVTLKYRIPEAEKGMTLNIVANCNRTGRMRREIEIE